jgi:pimeloyl-ACP methyl ester carboxylesterase
MMLKWLIAALIIYGRFVALLYLAQRSLQYFPERRRTSPSAVGLTKAEEVVLDTADSERVIVWHVRSRSRWRPKTRSAVSCWKLPLLRPSMSARMKDQFRSDLRAGKITAPALVVHGENDLVVPMALGKSLDGLIS